MNHSFNVELAEKYGLPEAILLENIAFWILKNRANDTHFYDGDYWTYNSARAFAELFPYWKKKQIERILKSLEQKNLIKTGNYNKVTYDRTKWYALTERAQAIYAKRGMDFPKKVNAFPQKGKSISPKREMDLPKKGNGFTQKGEPIPDINTNINTNINSDINKDDDFSKEKSSIVRDSKKNDLKIIFQEEVDTILEKNKKLTAKDKLLIKSMISFMLNTRNKYCITLKKLNEEINSVDNLKSKWKYFYDGITEKDIISFYIFLNADNFWIDKVNSINYLANANYSNRSISNFEAIFDKANTKKKTIQEKEEDTGLTKILNPDNDIF